MGESPRVGQTDRTTLLGLEKGCHVASTVATMQCPQPSLLFTHQGGWCLINNRRGT